jgi:hypothetical protein
MFAAHNGAADKNQMREAVRDRWGQDFTCYDPPPNKKTGKQDHQTSEDLSDALAVAQLVWTEYQLRHGLIALSDLHEQEIRVFNRITKGQPVALLNREWITQESEQR